MTYKGYTARVEFDGRGNIFVGHLLGIADVIGFHADNVADLRAAFEDAVEDYLETCAALGRKRKTIVVCRRIRQRIHQSPCGGLMIFAPFLDEHRLTTTQIKKKSTEKSTDIL